MAMDCETFRQEIDAWIDGEMSADERNEMKKHVQACEACRSEMIRAEALQRMCAEMDEGLCVPLQAQAAWRQAVRAEQRSRRKATPIWIKGLTVAAAAMVVLTVGTWSTQLNRSVSSGPAPTILVAEEGNETAASRTGEERRGKSVTPGGLQTASSLQSDGATRSVGEQSSDTAASETVVIRYVEREICSDDYENDTLWLNDLVSEYDAYFEERSETAADAEGGAGRVATAVIRVPSDQLDHFMTELDQLGETVMKRETAEDVTGMYMDTESRLNALDIQKEKLDDMLSSTESVEELIAIDDKLTEVISSLESLEGEIRRWNSQQNYSRVTLTLTETIAAESGEKQTLGEQMKAGFGESVVWLKNFGRDALVLLAVAAPKLVVWLPALALAAILIWAIARKGRKSDKNA